MLFFVKKNVGPPIALNTLKNKKITKRLNSNTLLEQIKISSIAGVSSSIK